MHIAIVSELGSLKVTDRIDRDPVQCPLARELRHRQHVRQLRLVKGRRGVVVSVTVQVCEVYLSTPVVQVHQVNNPALKQYNHVIIINMG